MIINRIMNVTENMMQAEIYDHFIHSFIQKFI